MALFLINRYTGDENSIENHRKRTAKNTLEELQKKAKERKIETEKIGNDIFTATNKLNDVKISDPENSEKKKKNKRKRKNSDSENVEENHFSNKNDFDKEKEKKETTELEEKPELKEDLNNNNVPTTPYDPISLFKQGIGNKVGSFTILGEEIDSSKVKVTRHLPRWITDRIIIDDIKSELQLLTDVEPKIDPVLIENLKELGIVQLFPVQQKVIPFILRDTRRGIGEQTFPPRDICVSAPTGSGKTMAFALPIVQALMQRVVPATRALVVSPTRELSAQIYKVFTALCRNTKLKCVLITGVKGNLQQEQRLLTSIGKNGVRYPPDIVVATPGRLVDHLSEEREFDLTKLRFLVIDEADRMMEQIKQRWLTLVEDNVYKNRTKPVPGSLTIRSVTQSRIPLQKLLFSATLSADPEKLQQLNLFQPRLFSAAPKALEIGVKTEDDNFIGKYTTPVGLEEYLIKCTPGEKPLAVLHLALDKSRVLCFAGSIETARRLTVLIQLYAEAAGKSDFTCTEFASHLPTTKRSKVLKDFSAGKINILVCSDAMARGLDVPSVDHVILYDVPPLIKTYIHRIGRTARAGASGTAYTLIRKQEIFHFKKMINDAGKSKVKMLNIPEDSVKELTPIYEQVLPSVAEKLKCLK
uniref:ATP-dependent RNA helicase n=1 Tax=Ciona savignyi TaxID=51511 RepID=H2ZLF9_CIOSA